MRAKKRKIFQVEKPREKLEILQNLELLNLNLNQKKLKKKMNEKKANGEATMHRFGSEWVWSQTKKLLKYKYFAIESVASHYFVLKVKLCLEQYYKSSI